MLTVSRIMSAINGKFARLAVIILTIALFVLSAAAPNATIGIGK